MNLSITLPRSAASGLTTLALAGLALAACGDDEGTNTDTQTVPDTAGTTDTSSPDAAETNQTADGCALGLSSGISGTWAVLELQTALVQVEPFGTMTQVSTNLYRAQVGGGAASTLEMTLCDWRTEDDAKIFTTTMGGSVLANLDPFVRDLNIETRQDGSVGLVVAEGVSLRGVELTEPATEALPTESSDARVVDQDGDTDPGISLLISGSLQGELWVIHRHKAAMDGCFTAADRVVGLTDWTTEQVILGSNPSNLSNSKPVASTHPDDDLSHFVMVKVADGDDCAAIITKRATLFPD